MFYELIHKSQRYDDDVASDVQRMRMNEAVEIMNQVFKCLKFIFFKAFCTLFACAFSVSGVRRDPVVRLLRDLQTVTPSCNKVSIGAPL